MNFNELAENLGLEKDEFMELVDLFVETGKPQLEQLKEAVEAKDETEIRRVAHSLKGASGNLGLMTISEMAKKIEDQCASRDYENMKNSVQRIEAQMQQLESERP